MPEYCPKCKDTHNGTYCSKCGTKLVELPKCPRKRTGGDICGGKIYPTDKFCSSCGGKVERR